MSFTISQNLQTSKSYPGLVMEIPGAVEATDVTYAAESLASLNGTDGVINYSVTIGGVTSAWIRQFPFTYSGTGNPITEGEASLQASLTTTS